MSRDALVLCLKASMAQESHSAESTRSPLDRAQQLARGGSFFEARVAFQEALRRTPEHVGCLLAYGCFLQGFDRHQEALPLLERALLLSPHDAKVLTALGSSLLELGEERKALACFLQAQEGQEANADRLNAMARCLRKLQEPQAAVAVFRQALQTEPNHLESLSGLAALLCSLHAYDEAEALLSRARELKPEHTNTLLGLGNLALAREMPAEALDYYAQAQLVAPEDHGIRYNRALALLTLGRFREGWELFEARLLRDEAWTEVASKAWRGQRAESEGKNLLLLAEQGLGDALQFARFIPLVVALGYRVSLLVHACQKRLFDGQCGLSAVYSYGEQLPEFDEYCPLLSLAYLLGCNNESSFDPAPYLKPKPWLRPELEIKVDELPHPRIGLVWAGNPTHQNDHNRSLPLQELLRALPTRAGSYIGLQKELRTGDDELLKADGRIQNYGERLADFGDTSALLSQLDMLISIDSSVAHLAGALGIPVLLLLPCAPDWRWQLGRNDSPWYPKTKLLRQTVPGDWRSPLEALSGSLLAT